MIKNTENKSKIISKTNLSKAVITGGITATLAFFTLSGCVQAQPEVIDYDQGFNQYATAYIEALKQTDKSQFDENFINIYRKATIIINGKEYSIKQLYISKNNEDAHLFIAGENNTDVLTEENFTVEKATINCFERTSAFYKMYQDGIITTEIINVDNETLQKYADNWDFEQHMQVPELKADIEANEATKRR